MTKKTVNDEKGRMTNNGEGRTMATTTTAPLEREQAQQEIPMRHVQTHPCKPVSSGLS